MKKIKKILAAVMTLAMVLGMSMTSFAAASATIQVENLEAGTTIKAAQVIVPDRQKTTGWDFVDTLGVKEAYAAAFGIQNPTDTDYQNIIWGLIKYADQNATVPSGIASATPKQIETALSNIPDAAYTINPNTDPANTFTVDAAGVYAIDATPASGSDTVYNPMAAYVSFTYLNNGTPTLPEDAVMVYAKKIDVPVEKSADDPDNATGISETVTYRVNTAVPYNVSTWVFTDSISGASYVTEQVDGVAKVPVMVSVNNATATKYYADLVSDGEGFTLNLSGLLETESNRGATVEFTYQAVVTGTEVKNVIGYPNHSSEEVKLYTGSITFTKYNEDKSEKLGGAGFKIYRINEDDEREYAQFSGSTPSYQLTGWGTFEQATEVFTNAAEGDTYGTLTVSGLDKDTYYFEETTAPAGYSINESDEDVTFEPGEVSDAFSTTGEMTDTELSALPSTGGIGTTIFTIGGCIIMIAAAGLFFASRRKSSK